LEKHNFEKRIFNGPSPNSHLGRRGFWMALNCLSRRCIRKNAKGYGEKKRRGKAPQKLRRKSKGAGGLLETNLTRISKALRGPGGNDVVNGRTKGGKGIA